MNKTNEEEKQLVEKAKTDVQAFGDLYDYYYLPIYRYLLRRTADYNTACDLTSQTFLKVLKSIKDYEDKGLPFSAWIYRIATNEFNFYFRKLKIKKIISLDFEFFEDIFETPKESNPESVVIENENLEEKYRNYHHIHKIILKLPLKQQEIITLRFFENKKIREISQILAVPENTVKSHIRRALQKLNQKLGATNYKFGHFNK